MFRWLCVFTLLLSFVLGGVAVNPLKPVSSQPSMTSTNSFFLCSLFTDENESSSTESHDHHETCADDFDIVANDIVIVTPEDLQIHSTEYSKPILSEFINSLDWPPSIRA